MIMNSCLNITFQNKMLITYFHTKTYNNMLNAWIEIKSTCFKLTNNISYKDIIWNYSDIKIDGKLVFCENWFIKGIQFIEHLYDYRTGNNSIENIDHLFLECTKIQNILSKLHTRLNRIGIILNLSKEILFFGELKSSST
jgi:hypothetical protein